MLRLSFLGEVCHSDFAVCNVMIDFLNRQNLPRLVGAYLADDTTFPQLGNNKVPFHIRIRVGCMSNLKSQLRQRKASIFRAGTDPENAFPIRRSVGVEPEAGRS